MIVREGYPFVLGSFVAAAGLGAWLGPSWAIFPAVLGSYFAYFFRNPEREIPADDSVLVAPADGKVMDIVPVEDDDFVKEPANKVIIFLSVFDVHVNRSPMSGEIKCQRYSCGHFHPAFDDNVGAVNERHLLGIANDRLRITVTQIAGLLARRIVSWVTLDDRLEKGQRYGLIKFGSCTEVVMPKSVEVTVKKGDKVVGGVTVIGRIKE